MCGEKTNAPWRWLMVTGSPPHVRGKAKGFLNFCRVSRITPACAGKRYITSSSASHRWDHPRMCGEKTARQLFGLVEKGSPPHVRGKACRGCGCRSHSRITPACAGKRQQPSTACTSPWDHPRMCGEKCFAPSPRSGAAGSPPHVRGKAAASPALWLWAGITPACAGTSSKVS